MQVNFKELEKIAAAIEAQNEYIKIMNNLLFELLQEIKTK